MRPPELRLFDDELIRDSGRFVPGRSYSPETQIRPGQRISPQTEIKPGERRSVATEFRPGGQAHNKLPVGSVTIRTDQNGSRRAWVKVAEPNKWVLRARVVWERLHGPVPPGKLIHHDDHDSINDSPSNLIALTRKEHAAEHFEEAKRGGFSSDEAREHAEARRIHPREKACEVCGTVFTPKPSKRKRAKTCSTVCANTLFSRAVRCC